MTDRFVRSRSTCRRWLLRTLPSAALLAAGTATGQPIPLPGLAGEATVFYDSDGIPHICAGSDREVFLLQGYVHAQDRFFQMDTLRRTFSGTLAELVGSAALASDIQFRTFGLRRAAQESLAAYGAAGLGETLEALEAYAAGVNRYLGSHALPPEYAALEITRASPWTVVDSLVIGKGLAFGLSFDLLELDLTPRALAYAEAGAALGFDGTALLFEDTTRHAPFDPTISIPGALSSSPRVPSPKLEILGRRTAALAKEARDRIAEVPRLEQTLRRAVDRAGSNWWVLSGSKTTSGHAMLAHDPHLGLNTPATFYENHLLSSAQESCGIDPGGSGLRAVRFTADGAAKTGTGGLNANGVSFAGVPGLVLGCNTRACWGATVNPMDVTDVYQEILVVDPAIGAPTQTLFDGNPEPLILIPQAFDVNVIGDQVPDNLADAGVGPLEGGVTLVVPRRNNGPIIAVDASQIPIIGLSVQYTGWRATLELEAFRRFMTAGSPDDFAAGLQYFDVGSQNFSYADIDGNIAYFTSAELPIREDLQTLGSPDGGIPPFLIRDGTHTLRHEWLPVANPQPQQALGYEILPFAEMPQVQNPPAGFIINANNDPIGTTLDNNALNQVRPGGGLLYLSPGYVSLRVGRIGRLIEGLLADGGKASVDDLKAMQANNQLLDAELVSPFLIAAFAAATAPGAPPELQAAAADPAVAEAIGRLQAWDFSTPTGIPEGYDPGDDPTSLAPPNAEEIANSVAATIWSAFRGQIVRTVIDGTLQNLGLGGVPPDSRSAYAALAHHLMQFDDREGVGASGVSFFPAPPGLTPAEARDLVLLGSLRSALDLLASDTFAPAFGGSTDQQDYRWGYLHRLELDHILGGPFSVPPAGGFNPLSAELRGLARSGGYEAVDASSHSARADGLDEFMFGSGPARRFVGVLDPQGIAAEQVIPGGQSGIVASPQYASQLGRWLTNRYHPFLLAPEAVAGATVSRLEFEPACVPGNTVHCFQGRRFKAELQWAAPSLDGPARTVPFASEASGNFYFFAPDNWEMLAKVLDGCAANGHYWVFASAATDLAWELTIEDTTTGEIWSASNPLGQRSPAITDTQAFATCP